jgi:putative tryptophan/tyrosine transport system substrate-binding protein
MRRRQFIGLLGSAAAWPNNVLAEQSGVPLVGVLGSTSPGGYGVFLSAFRQGLNATGLRGPERRY